MNAIAEYFVGHPYAVPVFLLMFSLLIAVHEFGHYLTARLLGMRVLEFAFGFPPRAFGIRHGGIDYTVNWIPFGGFVRILGQDDFALKPEEQTEGDAFTARPWWAQAIVLAAGVAMNFLLAIVVLTAAFALGTPGPTGEVRVAEIAAGAPADRAGLRVGDVVTSVDGSRLAGVRELVAYTKKHAEAPIVLQVQRDGRPLAPVSVVPRGEPPEGQGPLGIRIEDVLAPVPATPDRAFAQALRFSGDVIDQIFQLPGQLLAPRVLSAPAQVGGPIEIFRVTAEVAQRGLPATLLLAGALSLNLGILNILPFPGLDGGRLFFVLVAGIFRKRLSPQVEQAIHVVGFLILLALMAVVTVGDVRRVFGG
ncbi:MAG: M50 family metallopeptidase [Candidatus Limnocylindria bacterium]|nr:M50 family metallopeptidase [Candidatus Limnocylindria bacterium]